MKLAKFLLIFSAVTFVLIACKGAGADTAATDDTTDTTGGGGNPPPTTTYTVTVNANGGKLGNWKQETNLALNAKVAKPNDADLPTLADNEIAYWSTSPDMYNTEFKFGETKVTSNITIYPHWRWTLDYIKRKMEGDWVELQIQGTTSNQNSAKLYKINYGSAVVYFCGYDASVGLIYDVNDPSNATYLANLTRLKSIVVDTTRTPNTFYPSTYDSTINNYYFQVAGGSYYTYLLDGTTNQGTSNNIYPLLPNCAYIPGYTYNLNAYESPDSIEILMNKFYNITPGSNSPGQRLILKNYSSLSGMNPEFSILEESTGLIRRYIKK